MRQNRLFKTRDFAFFQSIASLLETVALLKTVALLIKTAAIAFLFPVNKPREFGNIYTNERVCTVGHLLPEESTNE